MAMKFYIAVVSFLIPMWVHGQAKPHLKQIDFTKSSRGYFEQVTITSDSVVVQVKDARVAKPSRRAGALDSKRWKELNHLVADITLSEIPALKSPTNDRTFDGALHGAITITTLEGNAYTHGFDNENPHQKLKKIVQCVMSIRDQP